MQGGHLREEIAALSVVVNVLLEADLSLRSGPRLSLAILRRM